MKLGKLPPFHPSLPNLRPTSANMNHIRTTLNLHEHLLYFPSSLISRWGLTEEQEVVGE